MKKLLLAMVIVVFWAVNSFATATVTISKYDVWGSSRVVIGYITISGEAYATGGISLPASSFGLSHIKHITLHPFGTGTYSRVRYIYDYTNSKLIAIESPNSGTTMFTASQADSFFVLDADNAANERPVVVRATTPPYAILVGVQGALTTNAFVLARDSSTVLPIFDTVLVGDVGLNVGVVGGDTVFYDEDGTDRLLYNGTVQGNKGDLYVSYGSASGRLIKIAYSATARTAGVPLYWDHDQSAADEKFTAVSPTNADGRFFATATYTALPYRITSGAEYKNGATLGNTTVYFVAIGD